MFIEKWEDFQHSVKQLQANTEPDRLLTIFKYEHKKGGLVVTVTDDHVRLQFKTDQAQDVKRLEKMLAGQMAEITERTE